MEKMKVSLPDSAKKAKFKISTSIKRKLKKSSSENALQHLGEDGENPKEDGSDHNSGITENSLTSTIMGARGGGLKPGVNIQPHITAALAVIDNIGMSRSPSLRRISVQKNEDDPVEKPSQVPWKRKKKYSLPPQKLIFSFSHDEEDVFAEDSAKNIEGKGEKGEGNYEKKENVEDGFEHKVYDPASLPTMIIHNEEGSMEQGLSASTDFNERHRPRPSSESSGYKSSLQVSQDRTDTASMRSFKSLSQTIISEDLEDTIQIKKEKKQRFWDFFTMVLSIIYAFTVVCLGICVYMYDILIRNGKLDEFEATPTLNLALSVIGIFWMIYLIVDIKKYINHMENQAFGTIDIGEMKLVEGEDGELHIELNLPDERKTMPEYYGFTSGRHSGSFFLKIGAGFFCAGHLIHMGVNVTKEVVFASYSTGILHDFCSKPENLIVDILIPLFSLLQCYVIFKFGNVIVNKNKPLARFAFMHCIASCLCIWMYTITNETVDALVEKFHAVNTCGDYGYDDDGHDDDDHDDDDRRGRVFASEEGSVALLPNCTGLDIFNCNLELRHFCVSGNSMSDSLFSTASLLYPFSIEFNILVVGVWFILWSNIGKINDHKDSMHFLPSVTPRGSQEALHRTVGHKEALIVFADCKSSINGLFIGISIFVITIICAIAIFVMEASCDKNLASASIDFSNVLESIILAIMIVVSVVSYFKIANLEVNPDPISFLDDMLLLICLPMFILYYILCVGPTLLQEVEIYYIITNTLTIIQVFIQTPLIVDGLRRCTMSEENQRKLKGRNTLMLLIVLNLAVYLLETVLVKSKNNQKVKIEFYGKIGWTVLSHITLPLCIFYRFHSAAALVDIWNAAYKPPEHH